jgi:hypothetical protein
MLRYENDVYVIQDMIMKIWFMFWWVFMYYGVEI